MKRRRIDMDVSVQEMMYYRTEEGLSNTEIAQRLGVNRATIIKYIGKGGPRKPYTKNRMDLDTLCGMLADHAVEIYAFGYVKLMDSEYWKQLITKWRGR